MHLPEKQKTFSQLFVPFLKSTLDFEHFKKEKMTLIDYIFRKLWTGKYMARYISKNPPFRTLFNSQ